MVTFVHQSVRYITCNLGTTILNGSIGQLCKLHRQIQGTRTIETRLASPEQGGKEDLSTVLQKTEISTGDRRTGRKKPYGKRKHQPGRRSRTGGKGPMLQN